MINSSDHTRACLPNGTKIGPYVIQRVIGLGGFSITYLAQDIFLETSVALKEFFPEGAARKEQKLALGRWNKESLLESFQDFLKEAKTLERFSQTHIVKVFETLKYNGTAYMAMEYVGGPDWEEWHYNDGPLAVSEALDHLLQICQATLTVHLANMVHGDIKPSNIIRNTSQRSVLLDFGAAARHNKLRGAQKAKYASPSFAPPEQLKGVLSPASDIYALAATFLFMVTSKSIPKAAERLIEDKLPQVLKESQLPHKITHALLRALNLDPTKRTQTVGQFIKELTGQEQPILLQNSHDGELWKPGLTVSHGDNPILLVRHIEDTHFISLDLEGTVARWSPNQPKPLGLIQGPSAPHKACLDPNKKLLFVAEKKHIIHVLDIDSGTWNKSIQVGQKPISFLSPGPQPKTVFIGFMDGSIGIIGGPHSGLQWEAHSFEAKTASWLPQAQRIATGGGGEDGNIRLWNMTDNNCEETGHHLVQDHSLHLIVNHPSKPLLLTAGGNLALRLWQYPSFHRVRELRGHQGSCINAHFINKGPYLVSTSLDGTAKLWSLTTSSSLFTTQTTSNSPIESSDYHDQYEILLTGHQDGTVCAWALPALG